MLQYNIQWKGKWDLSITDAYPGEDSYLGYHDAQAYSVDGTVAEFYHIPKCLYVAHPLVDFVSSCRLSAAYTEVLSTMTNEWWVKIHHTKFWYDNRYADNFWLSLISIGYT